MENKFEFSKITSTFVSYFMPITGKFIVQPHLLLPLPRKFIDYDKS